MLISFVTGLIGIVCGAFLAAWFAARRDQVQRRNAFIEKQLSEFYSPMLGLRKEIRTHSELRVKLQNAASAAWGEYCQTNSQGPEFSQQHDEKFKKYSALIEYDNEKFKNELMPSYNKMLTLFREKLWLVEVATREYYPLLVEFVEVWNRNLKDSIPAEVILKIGHSESNLNKFYDHIIEQHDKLCEMIKCGKG